MRDISIAATHTSMAFELEVINSRPLYELSLTDSSRVNSNSVHNAARPNYFSNENMNGSEALIQVCSKKVLEPKTITYASNAQSVRRR